MKKFIGIVAVLTIVLAVAPVLSFAPFAHADEVGIVPVAPPTNGTAPVTSFDSILNFVRNILRYTAILFWIVAIFYIFWAAFTYLQGGGDPKKVTEANQRLLYAAVAIAVGLMAYGIPKLVESILQKGASA